MSETAGKRHYGQKTKGRERDLANGPDLGDFIADSQAPTNYVGNLLKKSGER